MKIFFRYRYTILNLGISNVLLEMNMVRKKSFLNDMINFFLLKVPVQCHEIVCQLRPWVYSLSLNNAPRISFTLYTLRVKNL
jgi:hypothetical protein